MVDDAGEGVYHGWICIEYNEDIVIQNVIVILAHFKFLTVWRPPANWHGTQ